MQVPRRPGRVRGEGPTAREEGVPLAHHKWHTKCIPVRSRTMVAENQTADGRGGGRGWTRARRLLLQGRCCDETTEVHKNWRQFDSSTPYGGESLGAIVMVPRPVGKLCREERAPREATSGRARLVPWP